MLIILLEISIFLIPVGRSEFLELKFIVFALLFNSGENNDELRMISSVSFLSFLFVYAGVCILLLSTILNVRWSSFTALLVQPHVSCKPLQVF